jgi:hypothetical protein
VPRALAAGITAAIREYQLGRKPQASAGESATEARAAGLPPRNRARKLLASAAARLLYLGILAALPATLVALFNLGPVFDHASWGAWLTIASGALLVLMGTLLATNVLAARMQLIAQLRPHRSSRRGRGWVTLLSRLTTTALKLLSVGWILLGLAALARGSTNLN